MKFPPLHFHYFLDFGFAEEKRENEMKPSGRFVLVFKNIFEKH